MVLRWMATARAWMKRNRAVADEAAKPHLFSSVGVAPAAQTCTV